MFYNRCFMYKIKCSHISFEIGTISIKFSSSKNQQIVCKSDKFSSAIYFWTGPVGNSKRYFVIYKKEYLPFLRETKTQRSRGAYFERNGRKMDHVIIEHLRRPRSRTSETSSGRSVTVSVYLLGRKRPAAIRLSLTWHSTQSFAEAARSLTIAHETGAAQN